MLDDEIGVDCGTDGVGVAVLRPFGIGGVFLGKEGDTRPGVADCLVADGRRVSKVESSADSPDNFS
jgi:hypothetical protein